MSPLKPPVRARRLRVFHTGQRALTDEAVEALFRSARVITEGSLATDEHWYGSVMITFDLEKTFVGARGLERDEDQRRLVELIEGSVRVRIRAHRLAVNEVYRRFPDREVGTALLESRFRTEANLLLLDLDLEVPVTSGSQQGVL